jgi:hypothetical protein
MLLGAFNQCFFAPYALIPLVEDAHKTINTIAGPI